MSDLSSLKSLNEGSGTSFPIKVGTIFWKRVYSDSMFSGEISEVSGVIA